MTTIRNKIQDPNSRVRLHLRCGYTFKEMPFAQYWTGKRSTGMPYSPDVWKSCPCGSCNGEPEEIAYVKPLPEEEKEPIIEQEFRSTYLKTPEDWDAMRSAAIAENAYRKEDNTPYYVSLPRQMFRKITTRVVVGGSGE